LESYDPDNIQQMLEKMHSIEHSADEKKHEMASALAKAFVTPVDREDLDMLSHKIDDVTDMVEEILQKFYIFNIREIEPAAVEFAKNIVRACELLCEIIEAFENFKKSKKIRELIIALNDVEEECDQLYLSSMHNLTQKSTDVFTIISWRETYECFEACADACENASECVGSVIMKNT
ncbi:MAG: DUF47 family protein, partial [Oscillospiraceae bacterium]|nr:DUF47 family protein [Oscillospiraceae bacterium]